MFTRADSGLPRPCRHLLHALCMDLDKDEFVIYAEFQPSISVLARRMGCDRRTTVRSIKKTERHGWLVRYPPSKHDARTKHARTFYVLAYPAGFFPRPADAYPQARGSSLAGLGAQFTVPRGEDATGLEAPVHAARGMVPLKSSMSSVSERSSDGLNELVIRQVRERTGRTITIAEAARIRGELLGRARGTVHAPDRYLAISLARVGASELAALLGSPTPIAPPFASLLGADGRFLRQDQAAKGFK